MAAGTTRVIRTYTLAERAMGPEFGIHDERRVPRLEQPHRHDYFQVQVNLAGRGRHYIGAAERPLDPGCLSCVLPYRVHRVPHPPGSRFFVINFRQQFLCPGLDIDPLDLADMPLERAPELAPFLFQEFMDFRLHAGELERARRACVRMAEEYRNRRLCSLEIIRGELLLLLATVCRRHEPEILRLARASSRLRGPKDPLARVMRFVRENLARRISLAEAAAAADLSPNYLAHVIKRETGRTFTDLLTGRRMEKARELLAHTPLRIAEVAETVGFEDEAYFARRFRQCFRMAPREYRRRCAEGRPA